MTRQFDLQDLSPTCEFCGTAAPPQHGAARRGSFASVFAEQGGSAPSEIGSVWICDSCYRDAGQRSPVRIGAALVERVRRERKTKGNPSRFVVTEPGVPDRNRGDSEAVTAGTSTVVAEGHSAGKGKGSRPKRRARDDADAPDEQPPLHEVVGPLMEEERLADLHLLTSVQDLGPVAALEIYRHNIAPGDLLARPERYPLEGKRASKVIAGIRALKTADRQQARDFARTQVARAKALGVLILTYDHPHYPPLVRQSNNPQPLLWARGASSVLTGRDSVACVGSREIRSPYAELHRDFASVACAENFTIVSGFALGADSIGHRAALASSGRTVCVLPCGVDLVFPPENRELWKQLMASERALFISEFPLGRRAESLTLRKRNKLIVAAARGVMVSQTSEKGGAMNAYRFALEQKKQLATFEADGTEGTGGNEVIRRETSVRTIAFPASAIDASQRYAKWLRGL